MSAEELSLGLTPCKGNPWAGRHRSTMAMANMPPKNASTATRYPVLLPSADVRICRALGKISTNEIKSITPAEKLSARVSKPGLNRRLITPNRLPRLVARPAPRVSKKAKITRSSSSGKGSPCWVGRTS
jgi:hypothetical protein